MRYIPNWLSLAESRDFIVAAGQHSRSEAEADITLALRDQKIACRSADKIVVTTFDGRILHPHSPAIQNLRRQGQWRISTPPDLAPGDLDFKTSTPRTPWIAPGLYVRLGRLELSRRDLVSVFSLAEAKASRDAHEEASQAEAERKRTVAKRRRTLAARKAREEVLQAEAERKLAEARRKRKLAQVKKNRKRVEELEAREAASHTRDTGRARPRRYWARKAIDGAYPNGPPTKVSKKAFVAAVIDFAKTKGWNVGGYDTILREAGLRK